MAGNHKKRKRQIDPENMTIEQVDQLGEQIGNQIAQIMDEANQKCDKLLNIYGLKTTISYNIEPKDNEKET